MTTGEESSHSSSANSAAVRNTASERRFIDGPAASGRVAFLAAAPHFRTALADNPSNHNTRKLLVVSLMAGEKHGPAAEHLKQLLQVDPDDVIARLWLGKALLKQGQPAAALKHEAMSRA